MESKNEKLLIELSQFLAKCHPAQLQRFTDFLDKWDWVREIMRNNCDYIKETTAYFDNADWDWISVRLAKDNPEQLEKYAEHLDKKNWQRVGDVLAEYNPSFLEKYAKHFLQDDWYFIGEVLLCHNPEYIEKLKQ